MTDFKKMMSARFFFTLGVQMQAVIVGWRMYNLTHSPLALGMIGLAEAIPALSLALFAGYIVDRSRPLRIYRLVLITNLFSGLLVLVSQFPALELGLHRQILALYIASFISGIARSFSQPSNYAVVPKLVPRDELARASAWMSTAMQIARISGPAIGGILFGWWGIAFAAGAVCVSYVFAVISSMFIRTKIAAPTFIRAGHSVRTELMSGVAFVFGHPILISALSLDMISVLFGGVTALLPIYAAEILFIGPKGLGLLRAAPAVGAVVASLILTRVRLKAKAGKWLLTSVAGFGVCILIFGISQNFLISWCALVLSGGFDGVSMVIRTSAVQLASPEHMRGRISAVNSMFIGSSNELGEFESGVAARLFGTVPSVILGGLICLGTVACIGLSSRTLRQMDLDRL